MKTLLTIVLTIIALQANAQFKFNDGKATANMDTLGTRNDTLFLRNRVTGEQSFLIVENGETITTREKVANQIHDSIENIGGGGSMVYPGAGIPLSTGSAWSSSITNNSSNWNTAYSWGNHASAGYLLGQSGAIYTTNVPELIFKQQSGIDRFYFYNGHSGGSSYLSRIDSLYSLGYNYFTAMQIDSSGFKFNRTNSPSLDNNDFFKINYDGTFQQVYNNDTVFKTDISGNIDITGEYRVNGVPIGSGGILLPDSFSISRRGVDFDSIVGLKLDRSESWYNNDTIRDTLRIHVDTSQIGGSANITFVADSTFIPTVDVFSRDAIPVPIEQDSSSDPYDNTQGHRNEFFIYRNGDRIWWSWINKD